MCYMSAIHFAKTTEHMFPRPRPGRVLGHGVSAYLSCTFPWARGFLQLRQGPEVGALGAGVGATLLRLGQSLRQARLSHGLDLLQSLWEKLEVDLHHSEEAPSKYLRRHKRHHRKTQTVSDMTRHSILKFCVQTTTWYHSPPPTCRRG